MPQSDIAVQGRAQQCSSNLLVWLQAPAAGSGSARQPSPFAALRPATAAMAAARRGPRQSPFSRAATHDAGAGVAPAAGKMCTAPVSALDAAADAAIAAEAARHAKEAQSRLTAQQGLAPSRQAPAEQGRAQGRRQAGQQSQPGEQQRQAGGGSAGSSPGAVPVPKAALQQSAFSALSATRPAASEDTAGQGESCSHLLRQHAVARSCMHVRDCSREGGEAIACMVSAGGMPCIAASLLLIMISAAYLSV